MSTYFLAALPGLVVIGAGVALVALSGRDRTANEHDLNDYRPAAAVEPAVRRSLAMVAGPPTVTPLGPPELAAPLEVTEPARIWEHMVARQWLREIAAEQRARCADLQPRELVTTR